MAPLALTVRALLGLYVLHIMPSVTMATIVCSRPPPGVGKMVMGVDVTSLDLVPLWNPVGNRGIKSPVVSFTCDSDRKWFEGEEEYQYPDQVWIIESAPGGWLSANSKLCKSSSDVRRTLSNEVGGDAQIQKFGFSASGTYSKMKETIVNTTKFVADTTAFTSANRVDLIPSWVLEMDTYAQLFVDRFITGNYSSSPDGYHRFIQRFGTHYFSSANFGGFVRVVHEINTRYFYSKTENEAKVNAKASFLKIISVHGGHVSGSTTVDETFTRETSKTIRYFGGDTNLMSNDGLSAWQTTVAGDPWLFSGQLTPISDLIVDPEKKAGMVEAVKQHIMRSYLDDLVSLIMSARTKVNSPVLDTLLSRVNTLISADTLDESPVEALGHDVEEQIHVPDWFSTRSELCYKWRADGDWGQCGGGARTLLCARPNTMTSVYRDDSDGRGGGCRMQWGIRTSAGVPAWFNQVRVCYKWRGDGDWGQCGGGAARELCSSVNQFTAEYRDDTDGRGGGCRMQWRLVVPTTAPLWLQTAKMCFSWYPDGDGGQCGPAPGRDLCATANQWTGEYRDDTDGRGGGCRMSWGIKTAL